MCLYIFIHYNNYKTSTSYKKEIGQEVGRALHRPNNRENASIINFLLEDQCAKIGGTSRR